MNRNGSAGWRAFGWRIVGALRLNSATYREISWDARALPQAIAVILLSSLVSAAVFLVNGSSPGSGVDVDWNRYPLTRESNALAALAGGMLDGSWGLIVWAAQAAIIWLLWNRFGRNRKAWRSIAAPLGFANAPLIFFPVLEALPLLGGVLGAIGLLWVFVAAVVAARAALDTGWGRAVLLLAISMVILLPLSVAFSRVLA